MDLQNKTSQLIHILITFDLPASSPKVLPIRPPHLSMWKKASQSVRKIISGRQDNNFRTLESVRTIISGRCRVTISPPEKALPVSLIGTYCSRGLMMRCDSGPLAAFLAGFWQHSGIISGIILVSFLASFWCHFWHHFGIISGIISGSISGIILVSFLALF